MYPNGTLKWKYDTAGDIYSSPSIGDDNTIYFGDLSGRINALYQNGTIRWYYQTDNVVLSSPAIDSDGTIYCGSHDTYLYALYPNNGTLKWKYKTDGWIRVSPCIGDDGTIYVVSFDCYLHAVNPDGSLKWKTYMGNAGTSPTIGWDDTIYCGYKKLFAIYPTNGSVKWTFDVGGTIQGATPCHSVEDIIYFGTHLTDYAGGGDFVAVNPDGTERWRKRIAEAYVGSAPAIDEDGTIYIGSACEEEIGGSIYARGYLHAFGICELKTDADGPHYGLINHPVQFKGSASGGYSPYISWHWSFGDNTYSEEQNPIHIYTQEGNYTVTLTVTDNTSNTSSDTTFAWIQETNSPPNKPNIDGPTSGGSYKYYEYTFNAVDPDGNQIWYFVDWDDNMYTGWLGPFSSGTMVTAGHTWYAHATFTIKCKAKDVYGDESEWAEFNIKIPRNKIATNTIFLRFLERFPMLERLLFLLKLNKICIGSCP